MPRDAAEMATRWLACLARRVNNSDTLAAPRKPKQRSNRSEMKGSTALLPDRETAQSVNSPIGQYVRKGRFGPIDPKYYVIPYCDYVSILRRLTQITSAFFLLLFLLLPPATALGQSQRPEWSAHALFSPGRAQTACTCLAGRGTWRKESSATGLRAAPDTPAIQTRSRH